MDTIHEASIEELALTIETIEQDAASRLTRAGWALSELACEDVLRAYQFGLVEYSTEAIRGILQASIAAGRGSVYENQEERGLVAV